MTTFADYASYYDLLYRDKDYAGESAFILQTLSRLDRRPETLLDLGCGTGKHALEMAKHGIEVVGVDASETMLQIGNAALQSAGNARGPLPVLLRGDARTTRLGRTFDAVTSLFHVMSYQNAEEDLSAVLRAAWEHLRPGGLFLFDFWHGAGVLTDPPGRRERIFENEELRVHRLAVPEHRVCDDTVIVNYTITLTEKNNGNSIKFNESHFMRYWFLPELNYLGRQAGFSIIHAAGWMHDNPPALQDWFAYMVMRKPAAA